MKPFAWMSRFFHLLPGAPGAASPCTESDPEGGLRGEALFLLQVIDTAGENSAEFVAPAFLFYQDQSQIRRSHDPKVVNRFTARK